MCANTPPNPWPVLSSLSSEDGDVFPLDRTATLAPLSRLGSACCELPLHPKSATLPRTAAGGMGRKLQMQPLAVLNVRERGTRAMAALRPCVTNGLQHRIGEMPGGRVVVDRIKAGLLDAGLGPVAWGRDVAGRDVDAAPNP